MLFDFLTGLIAIWAGVIFFGLLTSGIEYLFWKRKGFFFVYFTLLFFRWDKDFYDREHPGKVKFAVTRLNQVYPTLLTMSMTYPPEKAKKIHRISAVLMFILSLLLLFSGAVIAQLDLATGWDLFLRYLIGGGFVYYLTRAYYEFKIGKKATGLRAKTAAIREVMMKEDPGDLPKFPFAYPEYSKAPLGEKVIYLGIFYRYAEIRNDLMALAEAVNAYLKLGTLTLTEEGHFRVDATLFAYYSFREKNPAMANKYYQHSKKAIERDMDCNGRRKLAYYAYFILGDKAQARTYLEQGLWALGIEDPRMSRIERELEERMLGYLRGLLENEA